MVWPPALVAEFGPGVSDTYLELYSYYHTIWMPDSESLSSYRISSRCYEFKQLKRDKVNSSRSESRQNLG